MPELVKNRLPGSIKANEITLKGTIEMNGGAIVNQTGQRDSGVTWTRNATGDLRAAIHRAYKRCLSANATITYPAANTAQVLTAGNDPIVQGISPAQYAGTASIASFAIACTRPDTGAVIDPTNNAVIQWSITLCDS